MSHVQSVERTFAILEAIATNTGAVSATEVAQQVGLPKSTVARLLLTLQQENAVERVANTKLFCIGPRILSLMAGVPFAEYIRYFVRPYLKKLTAHTGEASAVCLMEANQLVVADVVQSQHLVNVQSSAGDRSLLHLTSPGRVFLAYWPTTKLEEYITEITQQAGNGDLPVEPVRLRNQLAKIRAQGYAWSLEESTEISGIAVPIWWHTTVVACLNLFGPSFRFPPADKQIDIANLMLETSHQVSTRLQKTTT